MSEKYKQPLKIKTAISRAFYHSKVLLRGLAKTLYGTSVAGLVGLAVYGFVMIPSEGGYTAVCEFVVASITLGIAISAMYSFGGRGRKKGRYAAGK